MNKTKKALIAAFACSAVLAGAFGLAACNKGDNKKHEHAWSETWTVATKPGDDTPGKATRTCNGTGTCDATAEDKEYTLPKLTTDSALTEGYTKGTDSATCSATGSVQYTYNKDGVNVSFNVDTPINATAHSYKSVNDGPDGHHDECERNSAHKTTKVEHNTNGTDGACSVCGYLETAIQLKTDVTVTGATTAAPKLYSLTVEEGEYELLVSGNAVDTNTNTQIAIGTYTDGTFTAVKTGAQRTLTLTAGKYYVQASANVTFKLAPASEHQHAFNESAWVKNDTKHWHPAICVHTDEKSGEDDHSLVWEEADRDGVQEGVCVCGYTSLKYNATELDSENQTLTVEQSGNYTSTIVAGDEAEDGSRQVIAQDYTLINGDTAKKYTFKLLSGNTSIEPQYGSGLAKLTEKGASFSIMVEANDTFSIKLGTNDNTTTFENYAVDVVFRVTVEDAPAEGDISRPITVSNVGEAGKEGVAAGEEVYFKLDGSFMSMISGRNVQITGEGVSVYALGVNRNNANPEFLTGDSYVKVDYNTDYYIYAVSTSANWKLNFAFYTAPGEKSKPISGKTDGTANSVDLTDSMEQWFKLEGLDTSKSYIIKTTNSESELEWYTDISEEWPTQEGYSYGEPLLFTPGVTTVYIKASGSGKYTFTVAEFSDADKGYVSSEPATMTIGESDLHNGYFFYMFEAETSGIATITFESESNVYFWVYRDEYFSNRITSATNGVTAEFSAGSKYYIKTVNESGATGKFNLSYEEYKVHDYVITVDGKEDLTGVTVSLTYSEYDFDEGLVEHEVTGATFSNGVYTFEEVDPSKNYTVKVTGLGDYGYYNAEAYIEKNTDTATALTLHVYEKEEYKVKVALPDGVTLPEGATLEGIEVTLRQVDNGPLGPGGRDETPVSGAALSSYTATVDDEGVVTFKVLDPVKFNANGAKVADKFIVSVTIPEGHSLEGKFDYVAATSVKVDADSRDITATPLKLTAYVEYTVTLKEGDNFLEAGTVVTVNDTEYAVGGDGTFKISMIPGSRVEIDDISGYSIGTPVVDNDNLTISVALTVFDPNLKLGEAKQFSGASYYNGAEFVLEVAANGYYYLNLGGGATRYSADVRLYNEEEEEIYAGGDDTFALKTGITYSVIIYAQDDDGTVSGTITLTKSSRIDLDQEVTATISGSGFNAYAEYTIFLLPGTYQVLVDGQSSYDAYNIVMGSGKFQGEIEGTPDCDEASGNITITENNMGMYYVRLYVGGTFKIVEVVDED